MYQIRETMNCRPGKVRPLVEKFKALGPAFEKMGANRLRILTDVSGGRYWTMIVEFEVEDLGDFFQRSEQAIADPETAEIMAGYHDLVNHGRREIFKVEL